MRTKLFLAAAALILAACADDQPTAPVMDNPARAVSPDFPPGPGAPTRTHLTITTVNSPSAIFGGVANGFGWPTVGTLNATCPLGSDVIGGGYSIGGSDPTNLFVKGTGWNASNGWGVTVQEVGSTSSTATLIVTAICAQ